MQNIPMYLKPSEVKQYIGISQKTLRELKDEVFQKGIHYFIPPGLKHPHFSHQYAPNSHLIPFLLRNETHFYRNL